MREQVERSRYGLSPCGCRILILFLRKLRMHKLCSDQNSLAKRSLPSLHSPFAYINIWTCWPRTKKMDWTKCRVTPGSGIFKQTLPWCHGDQEVELTAILADLHLVVYPNLPGEAPAWPVTTVSGPNNTGISLGKRKKKNPKNAHRPRAVYRANKTSRAKHFGLPHFTITFSIAIFPSLALPIGGAERLVDPLCKLWRSST